MNKLTDRQIERIERIRAERIAKGKITTHNLCFDCGECFDNEGWEKLKYCEWCDQNRRDNEDDEDDEDDESGME